MELNSIEHVLYYDHKNTGFWAIEIIEGGIYFRIENKRPIKFFRTNTTFEEIKKQIWSKYERNCKILHNILIPRTTFSLLLSYDEESRNFGFILFKKYIKNKYQTEFRT